MTFLLKQIFGLFKLLNSENGTNQVAMGLTLGYIMGFSPWLSLQGLIIILMILIFRVQAGAATLAAFFFAFVAYLIDPVCHWLGASVLKAQSLENIWTWLYNLPLIPYTNFNNTIVMGGAVFGFLTAPLMFFVFKHLIIKYRKTVVERFKQTKVWKFIKATAFYKWYIKYDEYFG